MNTVFLKDNMSSTMCNFLNMSTHFREDMAVPSEGVWFITFFAVKLEPHCWLEKPAIEISNETF